MSQEGKVDYLLLKNHLEYELRQMDIQAKQLAEIQPLVPFAGIIADFEDARRQMQTIDSAKTAATLTNLRKQIDDTRRAVEAGLRTSRENLGNGVSTGSGSDRVRDSIDPIRAKKTVAFRAVGAINNLRNTLRNWYTFYNGYDPLFTWWNEEPYKSLDQTLTTYAAFLSERVVGLRPEGTQASTTGTTPNRGGGGPEPGKQPEMIRDLALEAIKFVDDHDLITVPQLARDTWRMEMMTPERQLVSPFFLGGEVILVSFPTNTMSHEQKLMSMRGNNIHFARATVFHELIPGHHLQGFMTARYRPYRALFGTPFWTEGGALYWEMLFWNLNFPKTPENRIGMLFWRMHRCARIIFSLSFHLEKMTPRSEERRVGKEYRCRWVG